MKSNKNNIVSSKKRNHNVFDKRSFKNKYTRIHNSIAQRTDISSFAKDLYLYLSSLHKDKTYITECAIAKHYNKSERTVQRAIQELRKKKIIDVERVGKKEYKYYLLEAQPGTEADKEEAQPGTEADKEEAQPKNNVIFKQVLALEKNEELEEDKKITWFKDKYNDICINCTSVPNKIEADIKDKILDIKNSYNDNDIISTLENFDKFINEKKLSCYDNFIHLVKRFKSYYRRSNKSNNRFNNYTGRTYTKKDFSELEKTFFN